MVPSSVRGMCGEWEAPAKHPDKGLIFGLDSGMCGDVRGMCGDVQGMCGRCVRFFGRHLINSRKKWILGCAGMCGGCAGDVWCPSKGT